MFEDDVTNPGPETAVVEQEVTETPEVEMEEGDGEAETAEPDLEDIEYEGKQYKLPKELREALLRQADYTRKTQEVADTRRSLDARKAQLDTVAKVQEEHIGDVAKMYNIDQQLAEYAKVNWAALQAQSPEEAQKHFMQYQMLKDARADIAGNIERRQAEWNANLQRERAKQVEEGQAVLAKEIPNWSTETSKKVAEYAVAAGYSPDEVSQITRPADVKTLWKAMMFDQMTAKQKSQPAPKTVDPVPEVSARKAPAAKDPSRMSTTEWMEWRRKNIARKG